METKIENKPIEFAKLYNITNEDFDFMYNSAIYTIKAGETKDFINYIAWHGARKLADKYSKTQNKDEKKVLMQSFLQNVPVEVMAERMNVPLDKIRQEVLTKEKEKARVINLEAQVADLNKKLAMILENQKKEEVKEEEKIDKRTKEYKESLKAQEAEGIK